MRPLVDGVEGMMPRCIDVKEVKVRNYDAIDR